MQHFVVFFKLMAYLYKMDTHLRPEMTDVRDQIWSYLSENDRTLAWLATKTHTSRSNMLRTLKKEHEITKKLLDKINVALGTEFKKQAAK